ncbi:MAG: thioredoxin domain-containing protein, partial [Desulfovibrio fairfieldensis]|nr:thioredoxin domain-containing protein [Desulfovibrio fairfieldensis]
MAEQVTDATFESLVLKSDLPVLLDFWAPWCGPCRAVGPIIDELAKEYEGKVRVVKMNVDE